MVKNSAYTELEWLEIFSGNLRTLMEEWGGSQRDLADDTGLAESTISRYLKGQQMPTVRAIINMSYVFGIDPTELIDFGAKIKK